MSQKISVECPHCGHHQPESPATISTVCKGCKQYFSLEYKHSPHGRRLKKQRPSRLVHCSSCGGEQKVYEDALSAVCNTCGAHLNIGSYNLEGVVRQRLATSGDIVFSPSVRYSGPEVKAQNVTVSGRIKARIRAVEKILLSKKSEVKGSLIAPLIRALRGADAEADRLQARVVEAEGEIRVKQVFARERIEVGREGKIEAATLVTREITVEAGGSLSGYLDTAAVPIADDEVPEEEGTPPAADPEN